MDYFENARVDIGCVIVERSLSPFIEDLYYSVVSIAMPQHTSTFYYLSTAKAFKSSMLTPFNAFSLVAFITTLGTFLSSMPVLASKASFHLLTQRHHLQPSVSPT
jgi:hypothetical protein